MENPTPTHWKARRTGPLEGKAAGRRLRGACCRLEFSNACSAPTYLGLHQGTCKRGVRDRTTLAAAHSLDLTVGLSTGSV